MFRSISLLLFGSERHHTELRCRTVLEMATNPQLFLDDRHWCGMHDAVTPEEIIQVASISSNPSLALAFQEEAMAVRKRCSLTGLWELFAASLATGCCIQSVHPPMGCPLYRLHCNQIVRAPGVSQDHKLFIMWTTHRDDGAVGENWISNHFVPLVIQTQRLSTVKLHSFYQVLWGGKNLHW